MRATLTNDWSGAHAHTHNTPPPNTHRKACANTHAHTHIHTQSTYTCINTYAYNSIYTCNTNYFLKGYELEREQRGLYGKVRKKERKEKNGVIMTSKIEIK